MIVITKEGMSRNGVALALGDRIESVADVDSATAAHEEVVVLCGVELVGDLVVYEGRLMIVDATLDGPRTWSGWSREAELAREATLRALMIRLFGAESVDLGWARIELQRFDGRSMPGIVVGPVR